MFSHPDEGRWWFSGQVNLISQSHGQFTSPYEGDNSLRPDPEQALSRLWTVYTGVKLPGHTELLLDIESAGGRGLSDALGLAGFTNLDVVRNPTLGSAPYIARAMVHVTDSARPATWSTSRRRPWRWRRMSPRAASRSASASWGWPTSSTSTRSAATVICSSRTGRSTTTAPTTTRRIRAATPTPPSWNTTRRRWSLRFGEALMPTVANGIDMDWNIARARAENLELELHPAAGLAVQAARLRESREHGQLRRSHPGLPLRSGSAARYRRLPRARSG